MVVASAREVLRRRLATHHLQGNRLATATEVVERLTCVQSQECGHAFFSLGLRSRSGTHAAVRREFDAGRFVRTHILRPTWHFVAAADLPWIQTLVAPRVQQLNAGTYRRSGLDRASLDRAAALIVEALSGGRALTRAELAEQLGEAGLPTKGIALAYLIMNAELEGLICSGAMRGVQQTYTLTAERLPTKATRPERSSAMCPELVEGPREAALAELTRRFFAGHGPASVRDFCRWSSLTLADGRAGLAAVRERLDSITVEGEELFFVDEGAPRPQRRALLLPLYDELMLSYPALGFPLAAGHPQQPGEDTFIGSILLAETNVGQWRRTVKSGQVEIELLVAPGLDAGERREIAEAAEELAAFLELDPSLSWPECSS
jgi:hypothetical protein